MLGAEQALLPDNVEMNELNKTTNSSRSKSSASRKSSVAFSRSALHKYETMAFFIERFSFLIFLTIFAVFSIV
jgi:hypothetical protein